MLGEIFLEVFGDVFLDFLWISITSGFGPKRRTHPVAAAFGLVTVGVLAGFLTTLVLPRRIIHTQGVRGASLLVAPLISGLVMAFYGRQRAIRGHNRSYFATFWGGALFALGMAVVRFGLISGWHIFGL